MTARRIRLDSMLALGFLAVSGVACATADPGGGGEGGEDARGRGLFPDAGDIDAQPFVPGDVDARPVAPQPDAQVTASSCSAPTSFAALGALRTGVGETGLTADGDYDIYWGPLETGMPGDHISIELWEGYGPFAAGLRTGSFTIAGDERNYATCGACAIIATDYDGAGYRDAYMAESGTISVTSVTGTLTGTLSNVSFRHVLLDDAGAMTETTTGCKTRITSASFSAPLDPAP